MDPAIEAEVQTRLRRLSLEQKVRLVTGADFWSTYPEPDVGLRRIVLSDGPAGVRGERWDERDQAANVPSPTALAASWNPALVERVAGLLARECRRNGVDVLLAPTVNLHRTPYGGRHFECFSEDPLLTGVIGLAYVRGLQDLGVAATVKHFVANDSETERFTVDVRVAGRPLRELYLEPFEQILRQARPWAVMVAYNAVNGTTMTEHAMLGEVLRDEWAFDGVTMSDWGAGRSTEAAARAGLDLIMPGPGGPWGPALVEAVREGRVPESDVDEKVRHLLRLAARVGALDGVPPAVPPEAAAPMPDGEIAALLREAAAAGTVLVRNGGAAGADDTAPLLPLDPSGLRTVAVVGPNAEVARTLGGGSATVFPPYTVSPVEGLRAALGPDVAVTTAPGVYPSERVTGAAGAQLLRHPETGRPGARVRFLAADGTELGAEDRLGTAFTWMGRYLEDLSIADVADVEVRAQLHAVSSGVHRIACAGTGRFQLQVDGEDVLDAEVAVPPGTDPAESIMRPPQQVVEVSLDAGSVVELVLRHRPAATPPDAVMAVVATIFQLGVEPPREPEDEALARAVELAAAADVAVVVVGTTEEVESEGFDRDDLRLPGRQDELVAAVLAANPRTVVAVNAGAPVLMPWLEQVPAVLLTWFPGQEAGHALADVLLGAREPGGRLPTTWPVDEDGLPSATPVEGRLVYDEELHVGYKAYLRSGRAPALWFGFGLGYTTWEYLAVSVPPRVTAGHDVPVEIRLRNTGGRRGREVVQVYAEALDEGAVVRPARWLVGMCGVEGDPGEEVTVTVPVRGRGFEYYDGIDDSWARQHDRFRLRVGPDVARAHLVTEVDLSR